MKKAIFILLLASVLAFTFVTSALAGSVLDRILQRGELVVGTAGTQPPLNATTKTGEIIGLDADISRLIAMNMGVNVKFVTLPFPDLLPALEAGKVDMILSSMTMTPDRNLKVAFVGPYFVSGKGILTKTETVASLQDTAGLNKPNFRVAALKDSTSQTFVQKAAPLAKLVTTKTYDEAIDMLNQDKIDALIADFPFCAVSALRFRDKGLTAGQARLTFEPLGIAVPEDTLLINFLQNFMGVLEGSGALKKISERWFNNASWLNQLP
ncbi:MAG: transporter substrate-binding domain-containing protein [Desulfobacteraceae bacterium]|jgi:polar amino acid transport system substrate-binding protein